MRLVRGSTGACHPCFLHRRAQDSGVANSKLHTFIDFIDVNLSVSDSGKSYDSHVWDQDNPWHSRRLQLTPRLSRSCSLCNSCRSSWCRLWTFLLWSHGSVSWFKNTDQIMSMFFLPDLPCNFEIVLVVSFWLIPKDSLWNGAKQRIRLCCTAAPFRKLGKLVWPPHRVHGSGRPLGLKLSWHFRSVNVVQTDASVDTIGTTRCLEVLFPPKGVTIKLQQFQVLCNQASVWIQCFADEASGFLPSRFWEWNGNESFGYCPPKDSRSEDAVFLLELAAIGGHHVMFDDLKTSSLLYFLHYGCQLQLSSCLSRAGPVLSAWFLAGLLLLVMSAGLDFVAVLWKHTRCVQISCRLFIRLMGQTDTKSSVLQAMQLLRLWGNLTMKGRVDPTINTCQLSVEE